MKTKMAEKKTGIAEWLRNRAERTPDKTAVIDPSMRMTFRQLAEQADCVSGFIQKEIDSLYGVNADLNTQAPVRNLIPNVRKNQTTTQQNDRVTIGVGIFMDKSCDAVAALIGVILSGNYYCVLDTTLPAARLLQMTGALKSSDNDSCKIVLTDAENLKKAQTVFAGADVRVAEIGREFFKFGKEPCTRKLPIKKDARVADAAYIPLYCSFTSGSTGRPKGVLISHQNILDFIPIFDETLGIDEEDVLACQAPFDFDISVKDIFSCLYKGSTLVLVPRAYFVNPTKLMDYLEENQVTTLIWAVSALLFLSVMQAPSYKKLPLIRQIIYSGEVMPMQHLRYLHEAFPQARFVNAYGPTETTCNCTYHILDEADFEKDEVPIGRAFSGRRVFLLNDKDEVIDVPGAGANKGNTDTGMPKDMVQNHAVIHIGEICVAGDGLALGYLEDGFPSTDKSWQSIAQISASRYENDAFRYFLTPDGYVERIYRTGDLATYDEKGELLYRGRRDLQIKMHGHRIELPEVEHHANLISGVNRSCCIFDEEKERLILFFEGRVAEKEIRERLLQELPAYMTPKKIICMEALPVNKHGKVDREELKKNTRRTE